jgi:signal transduction histidine kinase/ligand-binding sensor domain-containing protein
MPFGIVNLEHFQLMNTLHKADRLIALAILVAAPLIALDPGKTLTQDVHRIWGQEEGLFQPTVYSIVQTRNGFLWLGTQDSLIRFDGLHFREYYYAAEARIQRSLIRNLLEDDAGNLWVASIGNGLVRISPDGAFKTFTREDGFDTQNAFCLASGQQGSVFICTDKGLLQFENGRFHAYTKANGLPSNNIRAMCQSIDGTKWVAGIDFGLAVSNGTKFLPYISESLRPREDISALTCSAGNVEWIGKPDGLLRIEGSKIQTFTTQDGLPDNAVSSLHESPDGSLWIGTNDGVTRYRNGQLSVYRIRDGLSHSLVLSLYTDREGTLWVGTKNGLDQFTDGKVTPYTTNEGMLSNNAGAVVEDAAGRLWVGTLGQGLNVFDGTKFATVTMRDGLLNNTILSLFPESNGDVWVGTEHGLSRLHAGRVAASFTRAQGLLGEQVSAIFRDPQGTLWAGTNKGLNYLEGASFRPSRLGLLADNRSVYALSSIHSVRLFASAAGPSLSYLKDKVAHSEDLETSQPVSCFYFNNTNHVGWLGTLGSGLLHWKNGVFSRIRIKDGLYDNRIYAILRDDNSNLWFASSKGIFRVNEQELLDFVSGKTRYVTSIPFSTGQLRFECQSGVQPAACRTHDGRLWFSTTNGLVVVDPNKLRNNTEPPPVQITASVINGRRTESLQDITLNPLERNLEIRYAGLSFVAPEKMTFRYMLEGYDKNWLDAGARREAFFANLPPGKFRFAVMARNADGIWSTRAATLDFTVAPRIYERKWFFPALVLLLASAVMVWYRLRIRRLKHRFNLVLAERSRIARELHDTLLQGLSGVTMQLQALWTRLAPSKEKDFLREIIQDAARSSTEARQSLWGLRSSSTSPLEFTQKLAKACHEANAGDRLDLVLKLDPVSLASMPDAEFQLLRIAGEAVSNAVQHSQATSMDIQLSAIKSELHLSLSDNGIGFNPATPQFGHFGLVGMRERAIEIGARLEITSQPGGGGTLIHVTLPLTSSSGKGNRTSVPEHQLQ